MKNKKWMPEHWTFKNKGVAANFEKHVREQLPWYDVATKSVEHIARHYIPKGGLVYDIGASTGNMGRTLAPLLTERSASLVSIEESADMAKLWNAPGKLEVVDALKYDFQMYDFGVLFLVLMFLPICERKDFVMKLRSMIRPGGALVIVDKITTPPGYVGTCLRRMAMKWKLDSGATGEEIVRKELSLAGYQRPLNPNIFFPFGVEWFRFGEFAGWIIEREE